MATQRYKAIYFEDYLSSNGRNKSFSLAFNKNEDKLFDKVCNMSSHELKVIIGCDTYHKLKNLADKSGRSVNQYAKRKIQAKLDGADNTTYKVKDVTFGNSKNIPIHRWYPYIEGYSPNFVKGIILNYCSDAELIYEPFAGTGTTIFASDEMGLDTVYSEVNPLLQYLITTKLSVQTLEDDRRLGLSSRLASLKKTIICDAKKSKPSDKLAKAYHDVFGDSKYFPDYELDMILRLREYLDNVLKNEDALLADLVTIAVLSCLIPVSLLKKQGDLRFKTESERMKESIGLESILPEKLDMIEKDVANLEFKMHHTHKLLCANAKNIGSYPLDKKISAVITSPPYLNGTNYFRNTKLELWFLGYLSKESDLRHYRDEALTSGINDVKQEYSKSVPISCEILDTTLEDLNSKAYDKRIPLMAKCYFNEMYDFFDGLRGKLAKGANILIDLGDSIFSGVHIKTDYILIDIIKTLGYNLLDRKVLRQRRSRNGELLSQVLLVIEYDPM